MFSKLRVHLLAFGTALVFSAVLAAGAAPQAHSSMSGHSFSGGHSSVGSPHAGGFALGRSFSGPTFAGPARTAGTRSGGLRGTYRPAWGGRRDNFFRGYRPFGFPTFVPIIPFVDNGGFYDTQDQAAAPGPEDYEYDQGPPAPYAYPPYGPGPYGPAPEPPQSAAAENTPPQPPVTVVLRDGQKFQTQSFAVTNDTFWDFSNPVPRKVPISNIDVAASQKATATGGGEFPQLPESGPSK